MSEKGLVRRQAGIIVSVCAAFFLTTTAQTEGSTISARARPVSNATTRNGEPCSALNVNFSVNPYAGEEEEKPKTLTFTVGWRPIAGQRQKAIVQMADDDDEDDGTPPQKLNVKFSFPPSKKQGLEDFDSHLMFEDEQLVPGYTVQDDDEGFFTFMQTPDPNLELYHSSFLQGTVTIKSQYRQAGAFDFVQVCLEADSVGELDVGIQGIYESGMAFSAQDTFLMPEPAALSLLALGGLMLIRRRH